MSAPDLRVLLDPERRRLSVVIHIPGAFDWEYTRAALCELGGAYRPPPGDGPEPPWVTGLTVALDGSLVVAFADVALLTYTDLAAVDVAELDRAHLYLSDDPVPAAAPHSGIRWMAATVTLQVLGK